MISASELKKHFVEEVNSNTITNQHDGNRTSVDYERDETNIKHMHGELVFQHIRANYELLNFVNTL